MNEQYEKLRQVIIAANPEITELQFGCVVSNRINKWFCIDGEYMVPLVNGSPEFFWRNYPRKIDSINPFVIILGRPIRLADVLLAIRRTNVRIAISDEGIFFVKNSLQKLGEWNLGHDDLDWHFHNKPKTVELLINLLLPIV